MELQRLKKRTKKINIIRALHFQDSPARTRQTHGRTTTFGHQLNTIRKKHAHCAHRTNRTINQTRHVQAGTKQTSRKENHGDNNAVGAARCRECSDVV